MDRRRHLVTRQAIRLTVCWLAAALVGGLFAGLEQLVFGQAGNAAAWRAQGARQVIDGRFDAAIESYSHAIKLEPRSSLNWIGRALAYVAKNGAQIHRAMSSLEDEDFDTLWKPIETDYLAALKCSPDPLAEYEQRIGGEVARAGVAALLEMVEKMASTYSVQALIVPSSDPESAIALLNRATALLPDDPYYHFEAGFILLRHGRFDEAIGEFNEVDRIARLPRLGNRAGLDRDDAVRRDFYRDALELRGTAWRGKNEFTKALSDLNEAIRIGHKSSAYLERALTYLRQNDADRAAADFAESIRLDPGNHQAFAQQALMYLLRNQPAKALASVESAVRLAPRTAPYLYTRALAYLELNQPRQALADLNEALKLLPKLADGYQQRGRAYLMLNDWDRAIADFSETLRLAPTAGLAYQWRGAAYAQKGDTAAAEADWTKLKQLVPSMPAILRSVPAHGAVNVDPRSTEIVAVFDHPVRTDGWSITPVAKMPFPESAGDTPIGFRDSNTVVFQVALKPGVEYAIGYNTSLLAGFVSAADRVRARPFILKFKTGLSPGPAGADDGPQVIRTEPADGTANIEAGTIDLVIVFDEPMKPAASHVDLPADGPVPKAIGKARWIDSRTWVMPLFLAPGTSYRIGVNTGSDRPFVSAGDAVPARRYEWIFHTEDNNSKRNDSFKSKPEG